MPRKLARRVAQAQALCAALILPATGSLNAQNAQRLDLGQDQPQIATEIPGAAERVFFEYLRRPEVAARSWTSASINGCSGAMIGPNILLTAAHCRAEQLTTATFHAYTAANDQRTQSYSCRYLVHGWPETDIALVWCDPGADGVNPGDRWGYLDLDLDYTPNRVIQEQNTRNRLRVGGTVYSIWQNPIDALGPGNHMLFSQARMTNTTLSHWSNPGGSPCADSDDELIGVSTDLYGIAGTSGSVLISEGTNRALLVSTSPPLASGGFQRDASAIIDQLTKYSLTTDNITGTCANRTAPQVNDVQLRLLWNRGIRFDADINNSIKYYNRPLDHDRNGLFDVMQDLEASVGEQRRAFYNLRFESQRRILLWEPAPLATHIANTTHGFRRYPLSPSEQRTVLAHNRLNLDPNKLYWFRYRIKATGATTITAAIGSSSTVRTLSAMETYTFVETGNGGRISITAAGTGELLIDEVSISEVGTQINFDTFDQRKVWKRLDARPNIGFITFAESAAYIIPHARVGSAPDWAGVVSRRSTSLGDVHEPLLTYSLATPPGYVRVCFDHRILSGSSTTVSGRARLGGITGGVLDFVSTNNWQRTCTRWLGGAPTGSAAVEQLMSVEFQLPFAPKLSTLRYLVDNISVLHATTLPGP